MHDLPFGFDDPEQSPGFLLWQTTISWQRLIKKALEPHNISHSQFVIMALVMWFESQNYRPTQALIADWSKLDKMTVSKSLKKLTLLGYIMRVEHEVDTRAKRVSLSEDGRILVQTLVPMVEELDSQFFGILSQFDQQSLTQILSKLTQGF